MTRLTEIYGWKYGFDFDKKKIIVVPPSGYELPETLFKYYDVNDYHIDAIVHNYIYAAHPLQLNDIFDCNEKMIVYDNPAYVRDVLSDYRNDILEDCGVDIERMTNEELVNNETIVDELRRVLWQSAYAKQGIISLTTSPYNLLMWSYYSHHHGFCVEYDYQLFPFDACGPYPVNYQPKLVELHLKSIPFEAAIAAQFNVKNAIWKHEEEWRIMAQTHEGIDMEVVGDTRLEKYYGHERKFLYPAKAIKSVLLGRRFFEKEEILFQPDFKVAKVTLKANRNDKQRRKLLFWLSAHKPNLYLSLEEGLNELHFTQCEIRITEENDIELHVLDKLV